MPKIEIAPPDRNPFGRLTLDVKGDLTIFETKSGRWLFLFHTQDIRGFMGIHVNQEKIKSILSSNHRILVIPDNYGNLQVIKKGDQGHWTIESIQVTKPQTPQTPQRILFGENRSKVRFIELTNHHSK